MKLFIYLLAVSVAVCIGSTAKAEPNLVCEQPRHNFGEVLVGSKVKHTFNLFNAGDTTLTIKNIKTSCGCTVAKLESKTIAPGETADLPVTLTVANKASAVRKGVTVESDDPDQAKLQLWLEGHVTAPVTAQPGRVVFGQIGPGDAVKRSVDLVIDSTTLIRLSKPVVLPGKSDDKTSKSDSRLRVKLETVAAGSLHRLHVEFNPEGRLGKFKATVRIETDDAKLPQVDIPISVTVTGALGVAPESILLIEGQPAATRYLLVTRSRDKSADLEDFKITKVSVPDPDVSVELKPVGRRGYRIRLSNLTAKSDLHGKFLTIETDVKSMSKFVVPFRVNRINQAATPGKAVLKHTHETTGGAKREARSDE